MMEAPVPPSSPFSSPSPPSPPSTPSTKILTPDTGSFGEHGFADSSLPINFRSTAQADSPFGERVNARGTTANELGALFEKTRKQLQNLYIDHLVFGSSRAMDGTTDKPDPSVSGDCDGYNDVDVIMNKIAYSSDVINEAFSGPVHDEDASLGNDANDDANDDANYDANDEDDGNDDMMTEMDGESDCWSPLHLPHSCSSLGFASNPEANRFGCANTEICLVYNSDSRSRHCFFVCTERMKLESSKWAHKNAACHHIAYTPFAVVINCDDDGIVDAARLLFSCIHEACEPVSCTGEESAILARSTALALELGCVGVIEDMVQEFFGEFLDSHASPMGETYLHNVLFLGKLFRHPLVFQVATQKLAADFPCPNIRLYSNMWDGRKSDHFVHIEVTPMLRGITRACIQAEREVIVKVEQFLNGDQDGKHLDVPGHDKNCALAASRQLRRGLAAADMVPLAKKDAHRLGMFIESIKIAGGKDACCLPTEIVGAYHQCQPLMRLYGSLYKILDKLEFSICCF